MPKSNYKHEIQIIMYIEAINPMLNYQRSMRDLSPVEEMMDISEDRYLEDNYFNEYADDKGYTPNQSEDIDDDFDSEW